MSGAIICKCPPELCQCSGHGAGEDQAPDELSRLLDVQACAVLLLATIDMTDGYPAEALRRLRRAVSESAPGAITAARKALRGA